MVGVFGFDGVEVGQCYEFYVLVGIVFIKIKGVECQEVCIKFVGFRGINFFVFVKVELGNYSYVDIIKVVKVWFIQMFYD